MFKISKFSTCYPHTFTFQSTSLEKSRLYSASIWWS